MTELSLASRAMRFAAERHASQKRRCGEPYINHLARVAILVSQHPDVTEEMIAASLLHDCPEDEHCTFKEVYDNFGTMVGQFVYELTNASVILGWDNWREYDGKKPSREIRKNLDVEKLREVSREAKIIKAADRIDNIRSVLNADYDKEYLKKYVVESRNIAYAINHMFGSDLAESLRFEIANLEFYVDTYKEKS